MINTFEIVELASIENGADMKTATAVLDEVAIIKEFQKSTDTKENS